MWLTTTSVAKYCAAAAETIQAWSKALETKLAEIEDYSVPLPGCNGRLFGHRSAVEEIDDDAAERNCGGN